MNTTPSSDRPQDNVVRQVRAPDKRALVLGGGGSAGNAWLIGVVAGLLDAGVDVTRAELVIGTSAGSTAAAQIMGVSPTHLLADIVNAVPPQRTRPVGYDRGPVPSKPPVDHMRRTGDIIAAADSAADMRRRMGAAALDLDAGSDGSHAQWGATVAARLPSLSWPDRTFLVTAVDARTGEPVVFDRHSGVDLVDAIAASTSSAAPWAIGDERYIDGGYRRNENADLAAGYGRVLVLSPLGGRTRHPMEWGMQLAAQVEELRAGGSRVDTILPDSSSLAAFGTNLMNPAARTPAARAGYDQGKALAERLAEFWR